MSHHRGVARCLVDGWRLLALNFKTLSRNLWLPTLLAALSVAFLLCVLMRYFFEGLYPLNVINTAPQAALYYRGEAVIAAYQHQCTYGLIGVVAATVICVICVAMSRACLWVQIRDFATDGGLQRYRQRELLKKAITPARRLLVYNLPLAVVIILCLVAIILWAQTRLHVVLFLVGEVLLLTLLLTSTMSLRQAYLFDDLSLKSALKFWRGFKGAGNRFVTLLLTAIPLLFIAVLCLLPIFVFVCAQVVRNDSVIYETPAALPTYVTALLFVVGLLAYLVLTVGRVWQTLALALLRAADGRER